MIQLYLRWKMITLGVVSVSGLLFVVGCNDSARDHTPENSRDYSNDSAFTKLRKQAQGGDVDAQYRLGVLYESDKEIPVDYGEAVRWFTKAAERGNPDAQAALSGMYHLGLGVARQDTKALALALKAAENGSLQGQQMAAALYTNGDGIPQNYAEAFKWTQKAAMQNDPISKQNLGYFYARGLGVPQDLPEAYKWFTLALMEGRTDATNGLSEIRSKMSEGEVAEGQRRVSQIENLRK